VSMTRPLRSSKGCKEHTSKAREKLSRVLS
jgi:hypothetical protein